MISFVILSMVAIALFLFKLSLRKYRYPEPPIYPGGFPIIGHILKLIGDTEYLCSEAYEIGKTVSKNGGVMILKIFWQKYYVVTDPEDFMTAASQCLQKHYSYSFLKAWLGDGMLITQDTATWRRHRKLLNPSFSQQVIDGFLPVFNEASRQLVETLRGQVGMGPFDHSHYLDFMNIQSIVETAFGLPHGDVKQFSTVAYIAAAQDMLYLTTQRLLSFHAHSDFLFRWTPLKRRQDVVLADLNNMCEQVLQAKRRQANGNNNEIKLKFKAFMDLALELTDNGLLTEREVWEEMNTIIVAGFETNGNTLMFILLLLGTHPEEQEKVFQEIQEVFGDSDREVEKEDLSKLIYMEATIKECMRLHCITPVMFRVAEKDVVLKNYTIPAGSNCLLFNCAVSRDSCWGSPKQFRPSRFLEPCAVPFTAFGVGKRLCLGKNYAMMSMKTTLVYVLRHYRVSSDVTKLRLKVEPLLKPVSGHHIALEYRK